MEYIVKTRESESFRCIPKAEIANYAWCGDYRPKAFAQLIYIKDSGFALQMTCFEKNPKTVYSAYGDPVYRDSCMEFFVRFAADSPRYMNFEMNSAGAFLAAVREQRADKTPIDRLAPLPKLESTVEKNFWSVKTFFPLETIRLLFGSAPCKKGDVFFGNFYKCGDETAAPHFGMWSPVTSDKPDFHRPEFFGKFIID